MNNHYQVYYSITKAAHYDPSEHTFTPEEFEHLDEHAKDFIIAREREYLAFLHKE